MPFFDSIRIGASGAAEEYEVQRSFRFNDNDSAYLQRSPSSSTSGSTQKITISFWIKLGNIPSGTNGGTFFGSSGNTHMGQFFNQTLYFDVVSTYWINTEAVFRDPTAWYHVVYAIDTTQSTTTNRQKIYVNGVLQARGNTISDPSQNGYVDYFNNSSTTYYIGRRQAGNYFDGYMAEINFLDGYAYDPSYFGETNADTGQWVPKKYTGSYGTNGFYLDFSDNSSITNMCLDKSGNGNNFSPDNCNTEDSMLDTPTNNFATMNPLNNYTSLSQGNLRFNAYNDSGGQRSVQASIALPKSGKWYWEARYQEDYLASKYFGLSQIQMVTGYLTNPSVYYDSSVGTIAATGQTNVSGGSWYNIGSGSSVIVAIAVDVDNNSVKYYKDNSLQGTITLPTLTSLQEYFFTWANSSGGSNSSLNDTFNFGADSTFQGQVTRGGNTDANGIGDFKYAPPSGHLALCTANLPAPTIPLPKKQFDTFLYTATGNAMSFTDLDFQPAWIWQKRRDSTGGSHFHYVFDAVRGGTQGLQPNTNGAEFTATSPNITFTSNGYDMGASTGGQGNASGGTYASWNWNAGSADSKTYKVKVVSDSTDYGHGTGSNKYQFFKSDGTTGFGTNGVDLNLEEGGTYIFDWSDSSAQTHPIRFSLTNDGTHSNGTSAGTEYTTGVTKDDSAYKTTITIASGVANLYYYCQNHSGMGAEINTNSTKGSTNFDGTTLAVVKANPTAGLSIVAYTGNGSTSASTTIGHGLGVSPDVIITKKRDSSGTDFGWSTWHQGLLHSSYGQDVGVWLNKRDAQNPAMWAGYSNFTSTVFTPADLSYNNVNGSTYINYVLSEVAGYSRFGVYTGNGSSDGTFVYTGFRVAWLLVKAYISESWYLWDSKRNTFNAVDTELRVDEAYAETTFTLGDFTSNGFKVRQTDSALNQSSTKYIYLAFAESPTKNARAR